MYRVNQFLEKVKATSTGKLLDSLPRKYVVAEMCSGKFNLALIILLRLQSGNYKHHHHHFGAILVYTFNSFCSIRTVPTLQSLSKYWLLVSNPIFLIEMVFD
jgi:hypothetical protein